MPRMSQAVNSVTRPQALQTTVWPCAALAGTKLSQWSDPCTRRSAPSSVSTSSVRYTVVSPSSGHRERAASYTCSALRLEGAAAMASSTARRWRVRRRPRAARSAVTWEVSKLTGRPF